MPARQPWRRGTPASSSNQWMWSERAWPVQTSRPCRASGGGRGATIGRDLADRQRLAAMLDGGVGLGDVHGQGGARIGGGGQGRAFRQTGKARGERNGSKHSNSWKRGGRGWYAQGLKWAHPDLEVVPRPRHPAGLEFTPAKGRKILGCYLARGCK
jgi:hypothetical protein